nr:cytochrome c oxidase assembly protein [Pacificimonas flava]
MPGDWLARWNVDPVLLTVLALCALWAFRLPGRARFSAFSALTVLTIVFVSPLCALSSALFSARSVHHILLVTVAAPLLAAALPKRDPRDGQTSNGAALPFALSTLVLWAWHLPGFYTAALESTPLYWVMQASLFGTALWFWRSVLHARASMPLAALTLAAAAGQMGLLGAILTFAPEPLYPHHWLAPLTYGLSPLEDQQLAGLIMWVPAMLPYAAAAMLIARRAWPQESLSQAGTAATGLQ